MKAIARHLQEIDYVDREIGRTQSWKRKNDLARRKTRLEKELREYVALKTKKI